MDAGKRTPKTKESMGLNMNIIARPEPTGFAPPDSRWMAIDLDTYDGPPAPIGWGPTKEAAIADLMERLEPPKAH